LLRKNCAAIGTLLGARLPKRCWHRLALLRAVGELEPEDQLRYRFRLVGERAAVEVSLP